MQTPPRLACALLIIGNEILSGQTRESNLVAFVEIAAARGLRLMEAAVVRDDRDEIVAALNRLRGQWAHVFTSGGIGPTHDDITIDSVAAAFARPVVENPDALRLLEALYGGAEHVTPAPPPHGARSGGGGRARGRGIRAGIFESKMSSFAPGCRAFSKRWSRPRSIACRPRRRFFSRVVVARAAESKLADWLARLQAENPEIEIGSYPGWENGEPRCKLAFTAAAERRAQAESAFAEAKRRLAADGCEIVSET